ncbi:DUF4429 domain-containing protein [Pseudomonas rubra]|uniref:SHOCT domain-containing protein n=1 Tax=Pseudomonas rubra TaxID=2942627 RepID=A0ABT5PEZ6_9PSED|nr:DUF4429 domain-containing protein [Pseudomonas rubra]MDD1016876.1 SHOCT domain-containing protein [Pseudomonas rubra]MDD1039378.1 SHOCT domain-containing protein [Pseudomonas rubra]MDD1157840.1 SHOCT domain-containing protein [Pseudomonas rubra]
MIDGVEIFKGHGGSIELSGASITIKRKGVLAFMTQGLKGDKEIPISLLTAIQFKAAGIFTNGYIQFSFQGGSEAKGGAIQAASDENTVLFTKDQQPAFDILREKLQSRIGKPVPSNGQGSYLDDLERLAALRSSGALTEDEFQIKKRQILGL